MSLNENDEIRLDLRFDGVFGFSYQQFCFAVCSKGLGARTKDSAKWPLLPILFCPFLANFHDFWLIFLNYLLH